MTNMTRDDYEKGDAIIGLSKNQRNLDCVVVQVASDG